MQHSFQRSHKTLLHYLTLQKYPIKGEKEVQRGEQKTIWRNQEKQLTSINSTSLEYIYIRIYSKAAYNTSQRNRRTGKQNNLRDTEIKRKKLTAQTQSNNVHECVLV